MNRLLRILGFVVLTLISSILVFQIQWVQAQSIEGSPSSSPLSTPSEQPTPTPTASPSGLPVTSAIPSPTPTLSPITSPISTPISTPIVFPQISRITPITAPLSTLFTLTGTDFKADALVSVDEGVIPQSLTQVSQDGTQITFYLPTKNTVYQLNKQIPVQVFNPNGELVAQSNVVYIILSNKITSDTSGVISLPSGASELKIPSGDSLDLSAGLSNISTNPVSIPNVNLTNPVQIGNQSVQVTQVVQLNSGVSGQPVKISNTDDAAVQSDLSIPNGAKVLAGSTWDGKIKPPSNGVKTGNAPTGYKLGDRVIEIGSSDSVLLFDQPVTINLYGIKGGDNTSGDIAYKLANSNDWIRMNQCAGSFSSPVNPAFGSECYISDGVNTKVITYHLTSFALLSQVSSASASGSSSTSLSAASVPSCSDSRPGGKPTILGYTFSGNSVTLRWSKAPNPVSYYLIAYGFTKDQMLYGNPNVGGADTTSYTISGLSGGTTYYFKVRAGNGCASGDFSEAVAVKVGGKVEPNKVASGFLPGVLSAKIKVDNIEVSGSAQTVQQDRSILDTITPRSNRDGFSGFVNSIVSLFKGLFGLR